MDEEICHAGTTEFLVLYHDEEEWAKLVPITAYYSDVSTPIRGGTSISRRAPIMLNPMTTEEFGFLHKIFTDEGDFNLRGLLLGTIIKVGGSIHDILVETAESSCEYKKNQVIQFMKRVYYTAVNKQVMRVSVRDWADVPERRGELG